MIWYRAMDGRIEAVEVERDTPKQVVLSNGRRANKVSEWGCYFAAWEKARRHLVGEQELEIHRLRDRIHTAQSRLGQLRSMKPPE